MVSIVYHKYYENVQQNNSNLIKLGLKISQLRKLKGFSQEDFAAEVGIDRSYMGSVERGERNVAALNLIRIAKALEVEVGDIFPSISSLK